MSDIISFLLSHTSNAWIIVAILGFLPLSEVRIAVLYGIFAGLNHVELLIVASAANILEAAVLFLLMGNKRVMNYIDRMLGKKIEKKIRENKKNFEKYEELALVFLVAAPVPGTGAIIAVVAAEVLKLDKRWSFIAICVGVVLSAALVLAATNFFMSLLF